MRIIKRIAALFFLCCLPTFAQQINTPTFGPPGGTYTNTQSVTIAATIPNFGTVTADALVDMNTSTPGTGLTVAIANAGTISTNSGSSGCTVTTSAGATNCTWGSLGTGFTVGSNQSACANLGQVSLLNGSSYSAGSLAFNSISLAGASNNQTINFTLGSSLWKTSMTVGSCITLGPTNINPGGNQYDLMNQESLSGIASWVQLENGTCSGSVQYGARLETNLGGGGHYSPCIVLTPGGSYLFSQNMNTANGSLGIAATYTSGGTVTGSATQTCTVTVIGGGGAGAVGTVPLTGTNTIAGSTAITFPYGGQSGYTSAPTSATLSNGTATCSGTAVVSTTLDGVATLTVHNSSTGGVVGSTTIQVGTDSSGIIESFIGNGENGTATNPLIFQNGLISWTSAPLDIYAPW